jgi:hypothetical protein
MAGSFKARMTELQERVGRGNLVMRTKVHQPYAAAEHENSPHIFKHPRGGGPKFIEIPFETGHGEMLEKLASSFPDLLSGAIEAVQKFDEWLDTNAPERADVLKRSGNLYVEEDGGIVFEKPQEAPYEEWKE